MISQKIPAFAITDFLIE